MENTKNEEFEDALSLCDLSFSDQETELEDSRISSSDFFEFSTCHSLQKSGIDTILFCGKLISSKSHSHSNGDNDQTTKTILPQREKILRCSSSGINGCRKQKVMIGLAKIPAKMELADLRERHYRRSVNRLPAAESAVVSRKRGGGKSRRWALLSPFRCGTQELGSLLSRSSSSIGCLRMAGPCFD